MDLIRTKIALLALYSRLFVILLSVLANLVIPDHDAGVFQWTFSPSRNGSTSWSDIVVDTLTDGLTRWDGQYFLHIANSGYTYENTLAFFPLYPVCIRVAAEIIYWTQVDYGLIHFSSALKLGAVAVNVLFFVLAALVLLELSRKVLKDERLAYRAALFFCINPASIFFSAAYSESLHALLSFYVMLKVERAFTFQMGILLALSTGVRSNALLNLGFAAYKGVKVIARELVIHRRLKQLGRAELSETIVNIIGDGAVPCICSAFMSVAPFLLFQWYAFTEYCGVTKPKMNFGENIEEYGQIHHLKMPDAEPSVWCHGNVPIPYSYVQSHYWNVGFLQYFQFKQIPNFLLAFPLFYIIGTQAIAFFKCHKFYCSYLGLTYFALDPAQKVPPQDTYKSRILPRECFVYMVHVSALSIFCLFCVHVQISTRMICSSSPVMYWLAALLTTPMHIRPLPLTDLNKDQVALQLETPFNLEHPWKSILTEERWDSTPENKFFRIYFAGYAIVGTILFSNFLPWT